VKLRFTLAAVLVLLALASLPPRPAAPVAAKQENDPEIVAALGAINLYRSWLGIPPLTIDPALQAAAEAHVEYYRLNYGDPSLAGMGLHYETEGRPGFTGRSFQDRARAFGYKGSVNENAGISGSMVWSTEWFIATIGHRLTLLDPRYVHVGMAAINDGKIKFEIIDLGAPSWSEQATPQWTAWPPAGATGVGLRFDGEAPDPFPGARYPVSYPITLKYFGPGDLTMTSATISTGGQTVPTFAEIGSGWLSRKTIQLCANEPFQRNTTYTVRIAGTANGAPFSREWSFTTTNGNDRLTLNGQSRPDPVTPPPTPPPTPTPSLPTGVSQADAMIQQLWLDADGPVARLEIERSWLWGPDTWREVREPSAEAADGLRQVYYFDKARMEVNRPADGGAPWITAGLLVRDMIAGRVQVGEAQFTDAEPADVPLTGDPLEFNPDAPTYASLTGIASVEQGREVAPRGGQGIAEVLAKSGEMTTNPQLAALATYGSYDQVLGHNIAAVFDTYLATLPGDWRMSVGLPLTEPYWVRTNLAGKSTWVLVQAFERRILTYTPINAPDWRVEMGNVGRHYYTWRYGEEPSGS
jgi:uncharacterized protein YkwD